MQRAFDYAHEGLLHVFIGTGNLIAAVVLLLFSPVAALRPLRTLMHDRRECLETIRRIRGDIGNVRGVCDVVEYRYSVMPWARTYRVMNRCCSNEARKRKKRILAELRAIDEETA